MGRVLYVGEMERQARQAIAAFDAENAKLKEVLLPLDSFLGNKSLVAKAYESEKLLLQDIQYLVRGQLSLNARLAYEYWELFMALPGEDIDEAKIISQIEQLDEILLNNRSIIYILNTFGKLSFAGIMLNKYRRMIDNLEQAKALLIERLESLYSFEQATLGLFRGVSSIQSALTKGYSTVNGAWSNGTYSPSGDTTWRVVLSDAWKKYEETYANKAIEAALATQDWSECSVDPVNLATGNFTYEKTDFFMPGKPAFDMTRYFNGLSKNSGAFGKGWSCMADCKLYQQDADIINEKGPISLYLNDGSMDEFIPEGEGRYKSLYRHEGILKKRNDNDSAFEYITNDGKSYLFDVYGILIALKDGWGNKIKLVSWNKRIHRIMVGKNSLEINYSEEGNISTVSDSMGRSVSYEYEKVNFNGKDESRLVKVYGCDGNETEYIYDKEGNLAKVINGGKVSLINKYDDKKRTVYQEFPDKTFMKYRYEDGKTILTERNGAEIVYSHNKDNVTKSIQTGDAIEVFERDDKKRLVSYVDANGNETKTEYDKKGMTKTVIEASNDKSQIELFADGKVKKYTKNGKLIFENFKEDENAPENITKTIDCYGNITQAGYNKRKLMEWRKNPDGGELCFEYDRRKNLIKQTDGLLATSHFEYDEYNRLVKEIAPNGAVSLYEYDSANNLTKITDPLGNTREYDFGSLGYVQRIKDCNGETVDIEYNEVERPCCIHLKDGTKVIYEYDSMWNVSGVRLEGEDGFKYIYNERNLLHKVINPEGGETVFAYDKVGNIISETNPLGHSASFEYDKLNRRIKQTDYMGKTTYFSYGEHDEPESVSLGDKSLRYEYDAFGRPIKKIDACGNEKSISYTFRGKVSEIKDAEGKKTSYEYDKAGNLVRITYPYGITKSFERDINGNVIRYEKSGEEATLISYDCLNRPVAIEDEKGNKSSLEYDSMGRVTGFVGKDKEKRSFEYDKTGNIIRARKEGSCIVNCDYDKHGRLTVMNKGNDIALSMEYNKLGKVSKMRDGLGNETVYDYDVVGHLLEKRDACGNKKTFEYDAMGRMIKTDSKDESTSYRYDECGVLTKASNGNGSISVSTDKNLNVTQILNENGEKLSFVYDKYGRETKVMYPDGSVLNKAYGDNGKVSELRLLNEKSEAVLSIAYEYNKAGKLLSKTQNGIKTSYDYDYCGNTILINCERGGETLLRYEYTYDVNHAVTRLCKSGKMLEKEENYKYEYDTVGRLTKVYINDNLLREYDYDENGNRTRMADLSCGKTVTYRYNKADMLIEKIEKTAEGPKCFTYTYDSNGNLLKERSENECIRSFEYNADNRMIKATDRFGNVCEYKYNALGYRTLKTFKGVDGTVEEERYILDVRKDCANIVGKVKDGKTTYFVWGETVLATFGEKSENFISDVMGSITLKFSGDNTNPEFIDYDEFGNSPNLKGLDFSYTGLEYDRISDTYHAGMRQYSPKTGRFLSRDIIMGHIMLPETLNRYVYCMSSPLKYVDRNGKMPEYIGDKLNSSVSGIINGGAEWWDGLDPESRDSLNNIGKGILGGARMMMEKDYPLLEIDPSDVAAWFAKTDLGEAFLSATLGMERDEFGVYHARKDCSQQHFGYANLYDYVFKCFTSAGANPLPEFSANGETYTLWMWKGDYFNLGAGGETGIYYGEGAYKTAYTDSKLMMDITVTNTMGRKIMEYNPKETQWWITGFNPQFQDMKQEDLLAIGLVDFKDEPELWEGFLAEFFKDGKIKDEYKDMLCADVDSKKIFYKW
ncbi:MAG: DUF4474 domain-containing protein [Lachnospiraceae bacterium]|nr:DUF4474 domain-containing protein [Lachnospiraceae bacterium]